MNDTCAWYWEGHTNMCLLPVKHNKDEHNVFKKASNLLFSVWYNLFLFLLCQQLVQQFSRAYNQRFHWTSHTLFLDSYSLYMRSGGTFILLMVHFVRFIRLPITWKTRLWKSLSSLETASATEIHRRTKMFLESRLRGVSSQRKSWRTWAATCCYHGNTDKPTDAMTLSIRKYFSTLNIEQPSVCPLHFFSSNTPIRICQNSIYNI